MKIRITGAKKNTYWYADKIGRIYETDGGINDGVRYMLVDGTHGVQITDCEVVTEDVPVTVLPDESLGGVLREYREVKRKASVGERITFSAASPGVTAGKPYTIIGRDKSGAKFRDDDGDMRWVSHITIKGCASAVIDHTEVLRIGAERFRTVDRKAAVGERVIIVDDHDGTGGSDGHFFRVGNVGVYCGDGYVDFSGCGNSYVHHDGKWSVSPDARRVLEPLTSAELSPTPTPLSALPLADQYAENITVLTRKIAELEKRNTALESRILALETDSSPSYVKVASGPVDITLPTFSKAPAKVVDAYAEFAAKMFAAPPVKSAQQIRDEIVERAKADVSNPHKFAGTPIAREELRFWPRGSGIVTHTVEYVVNSDKRTVVALVIETYGGRKIVARGIAKCAPGETFSAHIGRAIALYRALGLEIPAEYLTCPQPETVRVGDVVLWTNRYDAADTQVFTIASVLSEGYRFVGGEWDGFETVRVIDDSREDGGISAASSALKGAA